MSLKQFLLSFTCLFLVINTPLQANTEVSLQLRWLHQFQFAGYYIALEKGFYKDKNLNVTILEGGPNNSNPTERLLLGEIDFSIASSGIAIERMDGKPIVALAAIMQTSPLVWITLKSANLTRPQDLINHKLALMRAPESAELLTVFLKEGLDLKSIEFVPTSYDITDLIKGKFDAYDGYISNEPYQLNKSGHEYNIINPKDYGVNFYNDVLITSEKFAHANPELVTDFTQASILGWKYALNHIDETIELIHAKYAPDKSIDHLRYEAEKIRELVMPDLVQIGHMNPGRWDSIAKSYLALGMTTGKQGVEGLIFTRPKQDITWLIHIIIITLFIILLLSIAAWRFAYLTSSLRREVHRRKYAEKRLIEVNNDLKIQATCDPLTQIYNRRAFFEKGKEMLLFAQRKQLNSCLFMIDLDYFKSLNDQHGHTVGDQALQKISQSLQSQIIREHDIFARIGGEEFAILMIDCNFDNSDTIANRILQGISSTHIEADSPITLTASIGVAKVKDNLSLSLTQADKALYLAKQNGRNCFIKCNENIM